jgi:hypothetical protein
MHTAYRRKRILPGRIPGYAAAPVWDEEVLPVDNAALAVIRSTIVETFLPASLRDG